MTPLDDLLRRNAGRPLCATCLGSLLGEHERGLVVQLERLQRENALRIELAACGDCGETAPTYQLAT